MRPGSDAAKRLRLESLFDGAVRADAEGRGRLISELEASDPEVALELRDLLQWHDRTIPAVDRSPMLESSIEGRVVGSWTIVRLIGRGGWADVYEARQESPLRSCALKILRHPAWCTPRAIKRFQEEAELLARAAHPGIAHVYGSGVAPAGRGADGIAYLAMELVPEARTLTRHAEETGATLRRKLELFVQVCEAVSFAHQRGVLHRDLKPTNILVGGDGSPRVIDFGVARAMDHSGPGLTAEGELIGTLGYMSPESLDGGPADVRSDVYSLGVVLFELCAGRAPFELPGRPELAAARRDRPPLARSLRPALPRDLCTIIDAAMSPAACDRYQSVVDLAADVRAFLGRRPLSARPTGAFRRALLAVRRSPALYAAATVAAAALATGAIALAQSVRVQLREGRVADSALAALDAALTTARSRRHGEDVKLSDLLRATEQRLDHDKDLSPAATAKIHEILGRTYENLADYASAGRHYQAGLEVGAPALGERHPVIVQLRIEMAGSLYDQGLPLESARALDGLLRRCPDLKPAELAKIKNDLAVAYTKAGLLDRAEQAGLDAYELRRRLFGPEDRETVQTLVNLGALAGRRGEHGKACERLEEAERLAVALGPDGSILRVHARTYLAFSLAVAGQPERAETLCRLAEEELARTFGVEHPVYVSLSQVWASARELSRRMSS